MKGKSIKRLLALTLAAASVMSVTTPLMVKASGNASGNAAGSAGTANQTVTGSLEAGTDNQPMEANGFISPEGAAADVVNDDADVSFGVVSDTHVRPDKETEKDRLAKAARFFSDAGLDSMVVAGDLTDGGSDGEYDAWGSILKENLSIPLIASMGNHENNSADYFTKTTGNKPNEHKVVNGYHFITLSPGRGDFDEETGKGTTQGGGNYTYAVDWLEKQLQEAEADTPDKPIFVFFHHPIKNTFYVSNEWYGSGLDEVFKAHPNAVTFSGHIHSPNNMPTSIWQDGGYTAVNTVTLSYMEMETGMIYGSIPPNSSQIAQGLVVEAKGSRVTIKNYDFLADKWIPQTWTFDVNESLPYTDERAQSAEAPHFPEDAELTVSEVGDDSVKLTFDQAEVAENNVGDLVHSYKYDFINPETQEVVKTFKTWSEYYFWPMPTQLTQVAPDLEEGTTYEVRIYAIDAYQKMSENYLSQTFKTTGDGSSEPGFDDMVSGIPAADLMDVDFRDGTIADHSESGNTFTGSDGSNIVMDEGLGKHVASFTGKESEAFLTDWSKEQYDKTNDDFTIETTFKVDKFNGSYVDLFANMESAGIGFEIPAFDDQSASLEAWVHVDGSYKRPIANGALKYGEWNHGVITYDGSRVTLYLNGQKVESKEAKGKVKKPTADSQYFVIGGDSGANGSVQSPMVGAISTARIYSEALSKKQVNMLANRELTALDKTKPLIQTVSTPASSGVANTEYTVPAAQAADNSTVAILTAVVREPDGTEIIKLGGDSSKTEEKTFIPEKSGIYQIVYTAKDPAGNVETLEFTAEIQADKTKLSALYEETKGITADGYTEESYAALDAARTKALEMLNNTAAGQEEIDSAYEALEAAKNGLSSTDIQKYAEDVLALAAGADNADASAEAIEALDTAMTALESAIADDTTTPKVKAAKSIEVLRAISDLNPNLPNITGLELAVRSADVLNSFAYTQESWSAFEAARTEAEEVLAALQNVQFENNSEAAEAADNTLTFNMDAQEAVSKVNTAIENMGTAITGLAEKAEALLLQLRESIAKADAILAKPENYTPDSIKGLQEARDAAKALLDVSETDENKIHQVLTALDTILNGAKKRADKAYLEMALSKASLVKQEEYTQESLKAFTEAYEKAKNVNADVNVSDQSIVDAAANALLDAMKQLVKINPDTGNDNGNNNNGGNAQGDNGQNHNGQNVGPNAGGGNVGNGGQKPQTQPSAADQNVKNTVKTGDGTLPVLPAVMSVLGVMGIMAGVVIRKKIINR